MRAVLAALALALVACAPDEAPVAVEPFCAPSAPSAGDAFAVEREPAGEHAALAQEIAAGYMKRHSPDDALWDWGDGVLMLGLTDLYRLTGQVAVRDHYQAYIDRFVSGGYDFLIVSSDRCPPALSALALYAESCEPAYRQVVTDTLDYLYERSLRTEDGGINHLGVEDLFGVSLWLDSLFMFGNVLVRWAEHTADERALDEYREQFLIFMRHLQDDSGWMRHAHDWPVGEQDDDVYWGRGNAWVTAVTYEYLRVRKLRGETDSEVEEAIRAQVDAIVAAQDPETGLWWTVLNRPGQTYLETSASALFAVGLARGYRHGFLGAEVLPVIDQAMTGVRSRIVDAGDGPVVTGISGPTTVGGFAHYAGIEVVDDLHYGVGAVLLALVETGGL